MLIMMTEKNPEGDLQVQYWNVLQRLGVERRLRLKKTLLDGRGPAMVYFAPDAGFSGCTAVLTTMLSLWELQSRATLPLVTPLF